MSAQQTLPEVIFTHSGPAVRSSSIRSNRLPLPHEQALPTESRSYEVGKRIFDVCFAFLLLPIAIPAMALISMVIGLTSGWPLVFSQRRVGRHGRPFTIWKFRTMHRGGERILTAHFESCPQARVEWQKTRKMRYDPRITPIGRVLRRTSLDEIPQIFNVLAGEMSFVGPRPIVRKEICKYGDSFSYYLAARPGITGLWQISGRSTLSYDARVILDEMYVRQWTLQADLRIMLKTPRAVLRCSEAC
jgi:exopolysaccharide production protein ExoY